MKLVQPCQLLKRALAADALLGAAVAALHLSAADWIADWTQLPSALLLATGLFMLAWTALLWWLARTPRAPVALVTLVIEGNLLWAAGASGLLVSGVLAANAWGNAYLVLNAVSVLAFAALEWRGLRASAAAPQMRAARA